MTETIPTAQTDPTLPQTPISTIIPRSKTNILIITAFIFVVILMGISVVYAYQLGKKNNLPTAPIPTPTATAPTTVSNTGEFGQITWLKTPVKTNNPDVLNSVPLTESGYNMNETYKVASFSSGAELLVSFVSAEGPGHPYIFRIIKQNNQYFLNESLVMDKYIKPELSKIFNESKIKFLSYDTFGLLPSDYIFADNKVTFTSGLTGLVSAQFFTQLKNPVKIASSSAGDFYATYSDSYKNSEILNREIYLKLPDFTLLPYRPNISFLFDDKVPKITYSSGSINKDSYEPGIPYGCGLGGANTVIKNGSALLNDKQEIGFVINSSDEKIYQIKSPQNQLIQVLYNQYKQGRDYPSAPPFLSLDQFVAGNNHFLYKDALGEWIIFVNSQYAAMVECGKPVIYLYPTTDTNVSVEVGANITKSEPPYPQNGWTVLAHPSGQLDYQGRSYPNLFWEGKGLGIYPDLTNYGTVVSQKDLIPTLKSQLRSLGLNFQESADFMDFWTDKLPTSPYTRLTWLGTKEMDQLAPLSVSPAPQTTIRIFLDFAGLQVPIKLTPQKLTSPPRSGFTLIEWGGLLVK